MENEVSSMLNTFVIKTDQKVTSRIDYSICSDEKMRKLSQKDLLRFRLEPKPPEAIWGTTNVG